MSNFSNKTLSGGGDTKPGLAPLTGKSGGVCRLYSIKTYHPTDNNEFLYNFPQIVVDSKYLNTEQRALLTYFQNYPYKNIQENFSYNNNTEYSIIYLRQSDFTNGTVRIRVPGVYQLQENIVFSPNADNDFQPTSSQISSGLYQIPGAYQLGFFAAITVECPNVVIDMNNFTISQSFIHFLQQRFYAHIELASAPFIFPQGPSQGISNPPNPYVAANQLLIINGKMGLSSHHGMHGNQMKGVMLYNLEIADFQVAGAALNGTKTAIIKDVIIKNSSTNVPVLSSYSQSLFIRKFLNTLETTVPTASLDIYKDGQIIPLTITQIKNNLNTSLELAKNEIMSTGETTNVLFKNTSKQSDANLYGLLLNVDGVAVNGFLTTRPSGPNVGNTNIFLQNITIDNINSVPKEIVAVHVGAGGGGTGYHSTNTLKGPVGGVFDINFNKTASGVYSENELANAMAIIGKYKKGGQISGGTAYMIDPILDWMANGTDIADVFAADPSLNYLDGIDSMAHVMKGNIGFFVQGALDISGLNINVTNVLNGSSSTITGDGGNADIFKIVASTDINLDINNVDITTNN